MMLDFVVVVVVVVVGASIKSSLFPVDAQAGQIKKQTQKNDSKVADQSSSEHLFDKLLSLSWF